MGRPLRRASQCCAGRRARGASTGSRHELGKIWASISLTTPGEDGDPERRVAARSSVMNLVVVAGRGEIGERVAAIVEGLTGRHPSRTIIVSTADPDGPAWIDAQVQAHCMLPSATAPGDVLGAGLPHLPEARAASTSPALVAPLLIHDLPVTVWWPGEPHFESRTVQELLAMADRILVDGAGLVRRRARRPRRDGRPAEAVRGRHRRFRAPPPGALARGDRLDVRSAEPPAVPAHLERIDIRYAAADGGPGRPTSCGRCTTSRGSPPAWACGGSPRSAPARAVERVRRDAPTRRRRVPVTVRPVESDAPRGTTLAVELHAKRGRSSCVVEVTAYAEGVVVRATLDGEAIPERMFIAPRRREADLLAETIDAAGRDASRRRCSRWLRCWSRNERRAADPRARGRGGDVAGGRGGVAAALRAAVSSGAAGPTGRRPGARARSASTGTRDRPAPSQVPWAGSTSGGATIASSRATTRSPNVLPLDQVLLSAAARAGLSGTGADAAVEVEKDPGVYIPPAHIHAPPTGNAIARARAPSGWRRGTSEELRDRGRRSASRLPGVRCGPAGIGPDGHVLSVFPGSPLLDSEAWVAGVPAPTHVEPHVARVSLNPRILDAARLVIVVVQGEGKAEILATVFGAERDASRWPAQLARREGATGSSTGRRPRGFPADAAPWPGIDEQVQPFGTRPALEARSRDGTSIALFEVQPGPRPPGPRRRRRPALLLVHGATADHTTWRTVGPALAARRSVFAMDRRGRGASGDARLRHRTRVRGRGGRGRGDRTRGPGARRRRPGTRTAGGRRSAPAS